MFQQQQSRKDEILEALKNNILMNKYAQRKRQMEKQQPNAIDKISGGIQNTYDVAKGVEKVGNMIDSARTAKTVADAGTVGSGIASSTLSSALPQGADALSFAGKAGDIAGQAGKLGKFSGAMGKIAPGIGGVTNGLDAVNSFSKGDILNGVADGAQAVLSFVPGVGQAVSLGIEGVQQVFNAQQRAKQKANQKTMAEAQKAQQLSEQAVANAEADANQTRLNNMQNMQEALAIQNGAPTEGQITGGASGVEQPLQAGATQTINNVQTPKGNFSDIMSRIKHGYNENVGQTFNPANLTNDNYERENLAKENLVNQLASNNITDEATVNNALQGLNGGNSLVDEIISKAGIIKPQGEDQIKIAREGNFNQYNPEVINKNGWDRFGEAIGTGQKILANPMVQGALASLAYKATGGDTGESIAYGIDWMRNKSTSDYYGKKINPNGKPQIFGQNYTANDYSNLLREQKNTNDIQLAQIANIMKQQKQDHDIKMSTNKDAREAQKLANDSRLTDARIKESGSRADYYKNKSTGDKEFGTDLSQYLQVLNLKDPEKAKIAKIRFIEKHGKDPDKQIRFDEEEI